MGSMQRAGRWFTMKMSSYRWLRKQEQLMLRVSNITAAMQEHGMDFPTYRYKKVLHDLQLNNNMAAELARIEPLAFRAIAETLRSDNCIMYDRHPDYREAKAQITKSALGNYNKFALNNPLPTIRRSPDPTWRELPMYVLCFCWICAVGRAQCTLLKTVKTVTGSKNNRLSREK